MPVRIYDISKSSAGEQRGSYQGEEWHCGRGVRRVRWIRLLPSTSKQQSSIAYPERRSEAAARLHPPRAFAKRNRLHCLRPHEPLTSAGGGCRRSSHRAEPVAEAGARRHKGRKNLGRPAGDYSGAPRRASMRHPLSHGGRRTRVGDKVGLIHFAHENRFPSPGEPGRRDATSGPAGRLPGHGVATSAAIYSRVRSPYMRAHSRAVSPGQKVRASKKVPRGQKPRKPPLPRRKSFFTAIATVISIKQPIVVRELAEQHPQANAVQIIADLMGRAFSPTSTGHDEAIAGRRDGRASGRPPASSSPRRGEVSPGTPQEGDGKTPRLGETRNAFGSLFTTITVVLASCTGSSTARTAAAGPRRHRGCGKCTGPHRGGVKPPGWASSAMVCHPGP